MEDDEILFYVGKKWVQIEANHRIGRDLTDDELHVAGKCIDWGLSTCIDVVFTAAIQEALRKSRAKDNWLLPYKTPNLDHIC